MAMGKSEKSEMAVEKFYALKQFFAITSVCFLCISCGNFLGYSSYGIPSLKNEYLPLLTTEEASWIGSCGPLGAVFGGLSGAILLKYLGARKGILGIGAPLLILSTVIITNAESLGIILFGRIMGGIGVGIVISSAPIYVVQIASIERRGRLGIIPQFLMNFGVLIEYTSGVFFTWRRLSFINSLISIPSILFLLMAPDSPEFLTTQDEEKSACTIANIYGSPLPIKGSSLAIVTTTIPIINNHVNNSYPVPLRKSASLPFAKPSINLKAVLCAFIILTLQQLTGLNGVMFYALTIFRKQIGFTSISDLQPALLPLTQCIGSLAMTFVIERVGRRILLQISSLGISLSCLLLGFYFYYKYENENLLLALLLFYSTSFAVGFGPVTWILVAEILPKEMRNVYNPILIAYSWLCVFFVTKTFLGLVELVEIFRVFWILGGMGVVSIAYITFFVPETKKKRLEDLRTFFN